jgi:predicted metal-dependent HD superfamily phosphohydrolase
MGFLKTYINHEEISSEMAEEIMSKFEMCPGDIEVVKGLVLATKIPQTPLNTLQEIICDADLDYLGRDDYPQISNKLYEELVASKIIEREDEWRDLQINFLKNHSFHTAFAKTNREPKKQYWLNKIINENT